MKIDIIEKYPRLATLLSLVPKSLIEEEIGSKVEEFESWLTQAKTLIPTVNLNKIFPEELERGSIVMENFLGHWGNVSIEELAKICLIIKWLKPQRVLELGTYNGMTTLQMALNASSECIIYTLDLSPEQEATIKLSKIDALVAKEFKNKFNTKTGSYFVGREDVNIVQLWGDTATFDYSVLDGPIDLIFIDAAHDYDNKKRDTENALRLLSNNGVILWHDYGQVVNPEVTKCLLEYALNHHIFHLRNTDLAIYRNTK